MIKKALWALVALSAIMAAASVAVVAAAFGLYALLSQPLGAPGAAAVVAGVAALIVAVGGLSAALMVKPRQRREAAEDASLQGRLMSLARQHPVAAVAAAAGAAFIAFRNPKLVTALLTGVLAGKAAPKN